MIVSCDLGNNELKEKQSIRFRRKNENIIFEVILSKVHYTFGRLQDRQLNVKNSMKNFGKSQENNPDREE
jgi:hypothetical protein